MEIEQALSQLALVGSASERLVQIIKMAYPKTISDEARKNINFGLNVAANIGICAYWHVDLFASAGFHIGDAGAIATGLVASFGTGILHDVAEFLKQLRAPKG